MDEVRGMREVRRVQKCLHGRLASYIMKVGEHSRVCRVNGHLNWVQEG
jgi:hypothetical protein